MIPTEKEVERAVVRLYRSVGLTVWSLSQGYRPGGKRHGTTRQTKGIADLFVTGRGHALWHETKRPGGTQRPEQATFEAAAVSCGLPYALGGLGAACEALRHVWGIQAGPIPLVPPDRLSRPS